MDQGGAVPAPLWGLLGGLDKKKEAVQGSRERRCLGAELEKRRGLGVWGLRLGRV